MILAACCAIVLGLFGAERADAAKSVSFRTVAEPARISPELPTALLAYDLCWSEDTGAARRRLAEELAADMGGAGSLNVISLPQLPPHWTPIAPGDARDLARRPINRARVVRGKSGYEASIEDALLDVLGRVRELRPGAKVSVAGYRQSQGRDRFAQYARLNAANDFVFLDEDLAARVRKPDRRRAVQWQVDSQRVWLERSGMSAERIIVVRHTDQWIAATTGTMPEFGIDPNDVAAQSPGDATPPSAAQDGPTNADVDTTTATDAGPQRAAAVRNPDLNLDGRVDVADKTILMGRWGTTDPLCDLDGDGRVGAGDLAILLGAWTREPAPEAPVGEFGWTGETYPLGSQIDIPFQIISGAPAGANVVFQVWSQTRSATEAVYTDSQAPFVFPWQMLSQATPGAGQVQALVRDSANNVLATFAHDVIFVAPSAPPPPSGEAGSTPTAVLSLHAAVGARTAPHTVNVDALASDFAGQDWRDLTIEWDFGDASAPTWVSDPRTGLPVNLNNGQKGFNASYVYERPGAYTIRLKVTNAAGMTSTAITTVTVLPSPYGPFDADGWTILEPSADSKVVYVSRSGNDSNTGLSPNSPVQTIAKAYSLIRNEYPDWVLFKRGDTWTEEWPGSWSKSGRSREGRMVIGAYGTGPRPTFTDGMAVESALRKHIAIVGLKFEAPLTGATHQPGIKIICAGEDFIIEDCEVTRFQNGVHIAAGDIKNVMVRRNVIHNNYSRVGGHSQGLLAGGGFWGLLVEGNIFHQNGHKGDRSDATMFNHNLYLSGDIRNVVVRNNIITEASSHGVSCNGDSLIENNVLARNAIGIFARTAPTTVRGNAILEGVNITPTLLRGFGIIVGDPWYNVGGVALVERNIVGANMTNAGHPALQLGLRQHTTAPALSATFRYNVVRGWGGVSLEVQSNDTSHYSQVRATANLFDEGGSQAQLVRYNPPTFDAANHFTYDGNSYRSARAATSWFAIGGANKTIQQWRTTTLEDDATNWNGQLVDPGRTMATYHGSLGRGATFQAFMAEAVKQSKTNWRSEYTAQAVLNYIRAGYAPQQ